MDRRIEPPEAMDPTVARFIEALARSAARRDIQEGRRVPCQRDDSGPGELRP